MTEHQNSAVSKKQQIAQTIIDELDHFQAKFSPRSPDEQYLQSEPFVALVETTDGVQKKKAFLICRLRTPLGHDPKNSEMEYTSYLAPMGQIVAKRIGEDHEFAIRESNGKIWHNRHILVAKSEFIPEQTNNNWDGINARIISKDEQTSTASLRRLLAELHNQSGDDPTADSSSLRTRAITLKVELPAQAILDTIQDEIFRLPFHSRVRISGAPGTGKTTVLLKRLSQKTKREFLTEDEIKFFPQGEWKEQDWILFTPSDLLKGYLEKALAKEQLPAGDEHVQVYWTFRSAILREMGVIKVLNHGYFRTLGEDVEILKRHQAQDYKRLADAFGSHVVSAFGAQIEDAFAAYHEKTRKKIRELTRDNEELLKSALDLIAEAGEDTLKMREAMKRAKTLKESNAAVGTVLKILAGIAEGQVTMDEVSPVVLYQMHRRLMLQLSNLGSNLPETVPSKLLKQIEGIRDNVRELADALSIAEQLKTIPRSYSDFRRLPEISKRFFSEQSEQYLGKQPAISGAEQDILLICILDLVRELWSEIPTDKKGVPERVVGLMNRMRSNVCIDEVTDFSPLEIACMERFAHPKRGGVTICGDLMQRITQDGITCWEDLDYFSSGYRGCELKIGYRQTARLFEIARQLHAHVTSDAHLDFRSAYEVMEYDPPALLHKLNGSCASKAEWLTNRIGEIFDICEQKLPSIAILVPSKEDVDPLAEALRALLKESAIEVDASHDGGKLGNPQRVRVFPVSAIKGLEFEAVFYVGIDLMEQVHKNLIDKYLYVGLSRARNFMGISYESKFPKRLETIRSLFIEREEFREASV